MKPVIEHSTASPDQVWSVLSDGWLYSSWVVGAARIRQVDAGWPAAGTRIHHSVGAWPALLDDKTWVRRIDTTSPDATTLELSAAAWPFGRARVVVTVRPDPDGTQLEMVEHAETPPMSWLPDEVQHLAMAPRLRECLRRLASMAEGVDRKA